MAVSLLQLWRVFLPSSPSSWRLPPPGTASAAGSGLGLRVMAPVTGITHRQQMSQVHTYIHNHTHINTKTRTTPHTCTRTHIHRQNIWLPFNFWSTSNKYKTLWRFISRLFVCMCLCMYVCPYTWTFWLNLALKRWIRWGKSSMPRLYASVLLYTRD